MKAIGVTLIFSALAISADIPKAPVPPSPYLPIIYKFADAMIERGRGTNGLFYNAMDRVTLAPLTNRPSVSPQDHQNFLRLLYTLSELSGKPKYRDAADVELRWFVRNAGWSYVANRPWMLWNRCFEIARPASENATRALSEYRHADPRREGFHIRDWAVAYAHTPNERFLAAITGSIERLKNRDLNGASMLSLAIDCDAASRLVPEPLAGRLRDFAADQDETMSSQPVKAVDTFIGMLCVSRYENTGNVAYRNLVHAAADAYLKRMPAPDADAKPMTFGHAISLQVAAWRSTAQQVYLDRARELADFAVKHFFDQGPLPRASLTSTHYEAGTGVDTLALGLVELHLHILAITAVRCPPNTIDR